MTFFVDSLIGTDFSPDLHMSKYSIVRILCCDEHPSQLTRSLPRLNEKKEGGIKLQYFVHQFIQDVAGNEIFKDAENAHLSRVS